MKPKKMSFANIKNMLSRDEMKKIVAGSDAGGGGKFKCCPKDDCSSSQCSTCVTVPKGSHADCSANPNSQVCSC